MDTISEGDDDDDDVERALGDRDVMDGHQMDVHDGMPHSVKDDEDEKYEFLLELCEYEEYVEFVDTIFTNTVCPATFN